MKLSFTRTPRSSYYRELQVVENLRNETMEIDKDQDSTETRETECDIPTNGSYQIDFSTDSSEELFPIQSSASEESMADVGTNRNERASTADVFLVEMATAIRYVKSWKCLEADMKNRRILGDDRYSETGKS